MFNLYANKTQNGIMSLIGTQSINNSEIATDNRRIITSFAVVSLLILSVIANGSQAQTSYELHQTLALTSTNTSIL